MHLLAILFFADAADGTADEHVPHTSKAKDPRILDALDVLTDELNVLRAKDRPQRTGIEPVWM
jgi:hypothetical protein